MLQNISHQFLTLKEFKLYDMADTWGLGYLQFAELIVGMGQPSAAQGMERRMAMNSLPECEHTLRRVYC